MPGTTPQFLKILSRILAILSIAAWPCHVQAQVHSQEDRDRQEVRFSSPDTLIQAVGGEIFGITLLIENNSQQPFSGQLDFQIPDGLSLLSTRTDDTIKVKASSRRYVPVRFRVHPDAPSGTHELRMVLNNGQNALSPISTQIRIVEKRLIRMQVLNNMELMRHENDSIQATLILRNTGNTDETIQLVSSIPNFYGSRKFQRELLYLEAGKDTSVHLGIIADRELFNMNQFQINITGLYDNQEVFGNTSINVQNASSSRNFDLLKDYGFNWDQRGNRMTVTSRDPFSGNQSLYLDANLQFDTRKGRMEMNSHLYQWGDWNNTPVLTNTYLRYTQDRFGLTLGNISESYEKYINGRGVKMDFLDSTSNYYFSAGVTDKSYDLLNQYGRMGIGSGYSVFSKYQAGGFHPERGKRYAGTLLLDRDPVENAESILHASAIPILTSSQHRRSNLDLHLGLGVSRPLIDTAHQFETQPSMALGATFNTEIKRVYFSSSNYYSTSYYPGSRRGALQLQQRAGMRLGVLNLWLGYSHLDYSPKAFITSYTATKLTTDRVELGLSWALSPFANISIIPYRWKERSVYPNLFNPGIKQNWEIDNFLIESVLSVRSRDNRHYVNLSMEGGFMHAGPGSNTAIYRGNLSYNFWRINLNAHYQHGGFSVFELINNADHTQQDIYRMGGSLNFNYLDNKFFRSYLGVQYFKDSFSGDNLSANVRTEVSLGSSTALFGQANAYRYSNNFFGSNSRVNFQVGFTQSLAGKNANQTGKRGNLEVFVFYDHNLNGIFDEGDEAADEKSILINDVLFLSDASGKVQYRKVPYGQYQIRAPMEKGWFAPDFSYAIAHKSDKVAIALQRSGTLRGSIIIQYDPRLNLEANTNLEGYTITASNQAGYITRTRSDSNGSFLLFLPEGEYIISLNEQEFPANIYTELREQKLLLEPGKINELPPFELKVRERKIEVKRFGSTP